MIALLLTLLRLILHRPEPSRAGVREGWNNRTTNPKES